MKFNEIAGSIAIDQSHFRKFISTWYNDGDNIVLVGIPVDGYRRVLSQSQTKERLLNLTDEEFISITRNTESGQKFGTYLGINPIADPKEVTLYKRGTEENVRSIYGCFIDFDVNKDGKKSGVFDSKNEILEFIDSLELEPTIVVDNGSAGGMHAYWRFDEPLELGDGSEPYKPLLMGWWAYLNSLTDKSIDRLIDSTRIARLPSSIYWPTHAGDRFDTVSVVRCSGKRYPRQKILDLSKDAYAHHNAKLNALRTSKTVDLDLTMKNYVLDNNISDDIKKISRLSESNLNMVSTIIQGYINDEYDWDEILEPHGWTYLKDDSEGSSVWARPGKSDRSAVVDYKHSTGVVSPVMSLLSSSEATGLSDLKEAGVPLTKMQVLLRLQYKDNVPEMISDVLRRSKRNVS